jgi:hypothetical protein
MANTILPVELFGMYPGTGNYSARIRRFDGLVYDPSDGTFKNETAIGVAGPWVTLTQGTAPSELSLRRGTVSMIPSQFVDGDYVIYFHDLGSPVQLIVSSMQISIFGGTWASIRTPTTTDIALRMFSVTTASHTIPGSYGGDWNTLMHQVAYLCQYVQATSGKAYPTS